MSPKIPPASKNCGKRGKRESSRDRGWRGKEEILSTPTAKNLPKREGMSWGKKKEFKRKGARVSSEIGNTATSARRKGLSKKGTNLRVPRRSQPGREPLRKDSLYA